DAQLVIARAYGFESWPKLKAFVEGATIRRLVEEVRAGNLDDVRAMLNVRPELARMSIDNLPVVLHAVLVRSPEMVRILMAHGADPGVHAHHGRTPLDVAAHRWYRTDTQRFENVAALLLGHGAPMTAAAAAALGDADWLRARHAEGRLSDQNDGSGGLLRISVTHDRSGILELLLDVGFDPDERVRLSEGDDVPFT